MSGYFDSEGCININCQKGNGCSLHWLISSSDKFILEDIYKKLKQLDYSVHIGLAKKADNIEYNKNYWFVRIDKKKQIVKLLNNMNFNHREKLAKYDLISELSENSKNANERIKELRKSIKNEVRNCVESAKEEYIKRHK